MTTRPHNLTADQARAMWKRRLSMLIVPLKVQPGQWVYRDYDGQWLEEAYIEEDHKPDWVDDRPIELPFQPGDVLWMRETWKPYSIYAAMKPREVPPSKVFYSADEAYAPSNSPWRPSMHMSRWASRMTAIVRDVTVLRVQDATGEQAERCAPEWFSPPISNECFEDADDAIQASWRYSLWRAFDDRHGQGSYERNPWCAYADLDVRLCNVDELREAAE